MYEIKVLEIKPSYDDHGGISIMETDLEVIAATCRFAEKNVANKDLFAMIGGFCTASRLCRTKPSTKIDSHGKWDGFYCIVRE